MIIFRIIPANISVSSDLPLGSGLGSSASYSISLVASMLTAQGFITCQNDDSLTNGEKQFCSKTLELICSWAFEAEKLTQKPCLLTYSLSYEFLFSHEFLRMLPRENKRLRIIWKTVWRYLALTRAISEGYTATRIFLFFLFPIAFDRCIS